MNNAEYRFVLCATTQADPLGILASPKERTPANWADQAKTNKQKYVKSKKDIPFSRKIRS